MLRRLSCPVKLDAVNPFVEAGIEAVRAAEAVILRHRVAGVDIRIKADGTPVTLADEEAERTIRAILAARFPEHGFHGEEGGRAGPDDGWVWLIDPLDGTRSFIRGTPFYSTQLALVHAGERVVGISNAPSFGELAWAARGEGSWMDGQRLAVSRVASLSDATLSTGNLRSLAGGAGWVGYGRLVERVERVRGYGDFCHYHMLAAGRLDMVLESDVDILDIGALSVIVEEAGGRVTDMRGGLLTLESTSVLATNGILHDEALATLWK